MARSPVVTFVVPCYKLAHLLPECVGSILEQGYGDFEVLVMDDASPDDTPEVARSFGDPRVVHVRNDPNLGHLRNYNKGIGLAKGRYVWLISADDRLRRTYVLEQFVRVLDAQPSVGYAFCSGVGLRDGVETQMLEYSAHGPRDRVFRGHDFLEHLLTENTILAASALVRKTCYDELGAFPLDMPFAGDWYMWCLFALHHDVAYFAEPMVCYREHPLSMTNHLTREQANACWLEEVRLFWDLKGKADAAGQPWIVADCLRALAEVYAKTIVVRRFGLPAPLLTLEDFERSLGALGPTGEERNRLRALVYAGIADRHFRQGNREAASHFYSEALALEPSMLSVMAKRALVALGRPGDLVRDLMRIRR